MLPIDRIKAFHDDLTVWRQDLHANPELGFEEHRTSDFVARKLAGPEKSALPDADVTFHESEYQRLRNELQTAQEMSRLPESPGQHRRVLAVLEDAPRRDRLPAPSTVARDLRTLSSRAHQPLGLGSLSDGDAKELPFPGDTS